MQYRIYYLYHPETPMNQSTYQILAYRHKPQSHLSFRLDHRLIMALLDLFSVF
nr:MAG TPA: hypothetical protein [Caudoviricetes sp.]